MKPIKNRWLQAFSFALGIGLLILSPGSIFAGGKGAWAILTDASVRWVEYPGSNGALIYDRETGLIWEQSPNAFVPNDWGTGAQYCMNKSYTVNSKTVNGFRLPTAAELTNLARDVFTVFNNVQSSTHTFGVQYDNFYMSSELVHVEHTASVPPPSEAFWGVSFTFNNGQVSPFAELQATQGPSSGGDATLGFSYRVMCVRGAGGGHAGHEQSSF